MSDRVWDNAFNKLGIDQSTFVARASGQHNTTPQHCGDVQLFHNGASGMHYFALP